MNEKLTVTDHEKEQLTDVEVFELVSNMLAQRFNKEGIDLWWTTEHASLHTTPLQWLEDNPTAVLAYGKRFTI
ncbi:MAG: hypothetical protein WAV04_02710 [Candidatus Microsaccharimonas sp.]|jgi:hypothetical protein